MRMAASGWLAIALLLACSAGRGVAAPDPAGPLEYARDVRPLLEKHCVKCHGPEKQKGDLRLDIKSLAVRGGADGAVIVPGKAGESRLIVAVSGSDEDLVMPPKGERLSEKEVGTLRRW